MSANQITGFYNRLEASRKYLFGSTGVLGEKDNSIIAGALILRGQDFKPVMEAAPDWESYSYTKLDLENEKDKSFFEAALAWDLEIDGKKWVDGKNVSDFFPMWIFVFFPRLLTERMKKNPVQVKKTVFSRPNVSFYCCTFYHRLMFSLLVMNKYEELELEDSTGFLEKIMGFVMGGASND